MNPSSCFSETSDLGGAFKALETTPSSTTCETSLFTRADERFAGLLQGISGQIDEINESDVLEYRRTTNLISTEMNWRNSELYALLVIKTSDTATASIKSLEEVEVE